mmetsp:Transcript_5041/g.7597  ORF Transcript_5041/g.7597 Transcript_5041/m.7597 type:complete len:133 (-) Transcript_5041:18-416(-)
MHHTLMKSTANNLVKICYEFIGSFPLVKSSFQANLKKSINHVCSRKALLEKLAKEREEFQNSKFCNRVKNRFPNIARMQSFRSKSEPRSQLPSVINHSKGNEIEKGHKKRNSGEIFEKQKSQKKKSNGMNDL